MTRVCTYVWLVFRVSVQGHHRLAARGRFVVADSLVAGMVRVARRAGRRMVSAGTALGRGHHDPFGNAACVPARWHGTTGMSRPAARSATPGLNSACTEVPEPRASGKKDQNGARLLFQ